MYVWPISNNPNPNPNPNRKKKGGGGGEHTYIHTYTYPSITPSNSSTRQARTTSRRTQTHDKLIKKKTWGPWNIFSKKSTDT